MPVELPQTALSQRRNSGRSDGIVQQSYFTECLSFLQDLELGLLPITIVDGDLTLAALYDVVFAAALPLSYDLLRL